MKSNMTKIIIASFGLLKLIREKNPRFFFHSDEELLAMCHFTHYPKELFKLLLKSFEGIKELQYSLSLHPTSHQPESLAIFGLINRENERFSFLKELNFSYKDPAAKIPVMTFLPYIEDQSTAFLRNNIYKTLPTFAKNNLDFLYLWKNLAGKPYVLNQAFLLLNDLCFSHDFSTILSAFSTADEIQVTLMGYLETLKASFSALTQFVRDMKNQQQQSAGSPRSANKQIPFNYSLYSQFLLQILNYLDIVKYFIRKKLENVACFEYFILPKLSLEVKKVALENHTRKSSSQFFAALRERTKQIIQNYVYSTIPNLAGTSELLGLAAQNFNKEDFGIEISLICLHHRLGYGFELSSPPSRFISTLAAKRLIYTAASAFSSMNGLLIKGPEATGKRETIKSLAFMIAKPLFNFTFQPNNYTCLSNYIRGALSGGYWLFLGDLSCFNKEILSLMSELVFSIRKAFAKDEKTLSQGNDHWKITMGFGLSSTFTLRQTELGTRLSFPDIPKKLLDSFRVANLVYPDSITIIQAYLFLMDFSENSLSFHAKQLVLFLNLLSARLNSSLEFDKNSIKPEGFPDVPICSSPINLDLKCAVNILNIAWGFYCDMGSVDEGVDQIAFLKAAAERWLSASFGNEKVDSLICVFNVAFGLSKNDT